MAQTIKLKRSATQGAIPTTAQLDLGEMAVNTYDGKVFIKKDDGTESIVEVTGGGSSQTPSELLADIKTVDGTGSGLDADLLDGNHASAFATAAQGALADSALQSESDTLDTVTDRGATTTNSISVGSVTSISDSTINDLTVGKGNNNISSNTVLGSNGLNSNTTGANNTAIGNSSLPSNTTGSSNTAVGLNTLQDNTTGASNVAVGSLSLANNTTGGNNTAVGYGALANGGVINFNTAVGYLALVNTTGLSNTGIGMYALLNNTTGANNTVIGYQAGANLTTGSNNTIVGRYNGNQGGLDIRTSNNYIVLSDGSGNPQGYHDGTNWTFSGSIAATGGNSTNWNTAYSWGDHASAGYLTSIASNSIDADKLNVTGNGTAGYALTSDGDGSFSWTDLSSGGINNIVEDTTPQLGGTLDANGNTIDMGTNVISDTAVGNWNTAYGWGDHSLEGYLTGNQTITLSGDVSGSGTNSIVVTVADDSHNHIISNVDGLQAALDGKVDDSQVLTNVPSGAVFTDTTYSVGNGGLTEINFTSALNSKLAGIEAGATADQTASEILTAIKTVDGSGSGLDADLLDGVQGSGYVNTSSTQSIGGSKSFSAEAKFGSSYVDPDSGVARDAKFGTNGIAVSGGIKTDTLNGGTAWTSANDGSGSGLDADLLDGQQGSYYYPASNPNGYTTNVGDITGVTAGTGLTGGGTSGSVTVNVDATISPATATELSASTDLNNLNGGQAGFYYQTANADTTGNNYPNGSAGSLIVQKSAGNATQLYQTYASTNPELFFRSNYTTGYGSWRRVWNDGNDGSGSGLDADLLDGQQGSYYLNTSTSHSGDVTGTYNNLQIAANVVNANELNVSGNGTSGQFLRSDGDGSFNWYTLPSYLTGNQTITLSGDLTGSGTTSINAQIAANVVGANELNVSGNGTAGQVLQSDGDGSMTWATPSSGVTTGKAIAMAIVFG